MVAVARTASRGEHGFYRAETGDYQLPVPRAPGGAVTWAPSQTAPGCYDNVASLPPTKCRLTARP